MSCAYFFSFSFSVFSSQNAFQLAFFAWSMVCVDFMTELIIALDHCGSQLLGVQFLFFFPG